MMNYLKSQILKILNEQDQPEAEKAEVGEKTKGAGKGGFKASIRETGTLAEQNPGQLMSNLGIKGVKGKSDIEKLFSLLQQAVGNTEAMSTVYGSPKPRRNSNTKKEGVPYSNFCYSHKRWYEIYYSYYLRSAKRKCG